jgi:sulfatase maturation enzyme AslB (radical SAM superfamily)
METVSVQHRPSMIPSKDVCGRIVCQGIKELWFHTGTNCNLQCHGCFEGAGPGVHRIETATYDDMRPCIDAATACGVEKFSFTGGEPFLNPDILQTLDYALERAPCLALSNGTAPLRDKAGQLEALLKKRHPLSFRISLDFPDSAQHDALRGPGRFQEALAGIQFLHRTGFAVSVARRMRNNEQPEAAETAYSELFVNNGLPSNLPLVGFPELLHVTPLQISEYCLAQYHTEESRAGFMCAFSRMIVKKNGKMGVYACTLVDDDLTFHLGAELKQAIARPVMLQHPRCSVCFSQGVSCSGQ